MQRLHGHVQHWSLCSSAWSAVCPGALSEMGALTVQSRNFGAEHQIQRLRLKGAVGRVFRQTNPPRLNKNATEHYLKKLRSRGGELARRQLAASKAAVPATTSQRQPALTSEQKTALLWRHVPDEAEAVNELRKSSHKWMWRYIKKRDWKRFDVCLEEMHNRGLIFDEVT